MSFGDAAELFRLGGVEFNPVSKTITVGHRVTFLDARACAIFSALVDRSGGRVSKEELLQIGWPNRLVHENSVAKTISKLRAAIVGSTLEISASYGFGYMLRDMCASSANDAARALDNNGTAEDIAPAAPAVRADRPKRLVLAAFVAGAVVLAGVAFLARDSSAPVPTRIRSEPPVTNDPRDASATILWIDDHPSNNVLEVEEIKRHNIAVHLAVSTDDALKLMAMNSYHLIVSDLGRADDRLAGLKMIAQMRDRAIAVPVLIYTMQPKDRAGQIAQRKLVAEAGAGGLAVTPQEVRRKVLQEFGNPPRSEDS